MVVDAESGAIVSHEGKKKEKVSLDDRLKETKSAVRPIQNLEDAVAMQLRLVEKLKEHRKVDFSLPAEEVDELPPLQLWLPFKKPPAPLDDPTQGNSPQPPGCGTNECPPGSN